VLGHEIGLLRRAPPFRSLFVATLGSSLGTLLAVVALTVDVERRTGSGTWVGALLLVDFLPAIAVGLLLGSLLDRLSRRRLMIVADLVRAAVFCVLPFVDGALAIVLLAGVVGFATGFFRPAVYAGLPNLVDEPDLPRANALLQTVENATWALGPVLGGLIVAAWSPDGAYWINAVTFVVSAAFVIRIPSRLLQSAEALSRGHWRDLRDGFALVGASRPLLLVLVAWSVAMVGVGFVNVAEIFLAQDVFEAGPVGFGLLYGSIGLGLAVGSALAAGRIDAFGVRIVYLGSLALMAAGFGAAAGAPNVWLAAAFAAVAGIGNGAAGVCNALLVQRGAPDAMRGRAFTTVMSVNFGALGLATAAAGPVTDAVGARGAWAVAAGALAVAAAVAGALSRTLPREVPPEPRAGAVVPVLAPEAVVPVGDRGIGVAGPEPAPGRESPTASRE
jgi:MFS family permease